MNNFPHLFAALLLLRKSGRSWDDIRAEFIALIDRQIALAKESERAAKN